MIKIYEANARTRIFYKATNSLGYSEESSSQMVEPGIVQITSDRVPGWRKLLANGGLATGALTAAGFKTVRGETSHSTSVRTPRYGYPGQFVTSSETRIGLGNMQGELALQPLPTSEHMRRLSDEAYIQLIQKAKKLRQEFQSGVFLGELPETLHGFGSLSKDLHSLFRGKWVEGQTLARSLIGKNPKETADRLSDWWLSWSFAVKPTLSDVAELSNALAAIHSRGGNVTSTLVKASAESDDVEQSPEYDLIQGLQKTKAAWKSSRYGKIKLAAVVAASATGPVMAHEIVGFEPSEFIPTLWELLPYSWLADYFTNAGEVLAAWSDTTFSGVDLIQVTSVQRSRVYRILHRSDTAAYAKAQGWELTGDAFSPGQVSRERFFINRQKVRNRTLLPSLRLELPSWRQGATAAAFFWARLARSP